MASFSETRDLLRLQTMEMRLLEAQLAQPGLLSQEHVDRLRAIINLAKLTEFQPGAAYTGRRNQRPDVPVHYDEIGKLRNLTLQMLRPLRKSDDNEKLQIHAREALENLWPIAVDTRVSILARHINDFSAAELNAEIGTKHLVNVGGGGGGAGFVYIGAWQKMQESNIVPDFLIGASIGTVLGAFRARRVDTDFREEIALAKSLSPRTIFKRTTLVPRHGMPGLLRLALQRPLGQMFSNADGSAMRIEDLEIPFEAVVAGVRKRVYERLPRILREPESSWTRNTRFSLQVAERMWKLTAFFAPRVVKEITLGGDPITSRANVIDALSFSAAIPAILHHEVDPTDTEMVEMLDALMLQDELFALVDGGVANNVPGRTAWRHVQRGKIGTRNCFYLGFDCFHPQLAPRHLWLWPITQGVQLQMMVNGPYMDRVVRFKPTLSPVNLMPSGDQIDRAIGWGRAQIEKELPLLKAALTPFEWPARG